MFDAFYSPLGYTILNRIAMHYGAIGEHDLESLDLSGRLLIDAQTPWCTGSGVSYLFEREFWVNQPNAEPSLDLWGGALFGAFTIMAAFLEQLAYEKKENELLAWLSRHRAKVFDRLGSVLASRFDPSRLERAASDLSTTGFTRPQRQFAMLWMTREINLVAPAPATPTKTAEA